MAIERDDVLYVARLARLTLEPDEVTGLMRDLSAVLEYMELLKELPTDAIEPTAHVSVTAMPLRPDAVVPVLARDTVLEQAPRAREGGFAVPGFVDES
jgi:aspartyl-tRNA(Asn)/glutamyl-tRNA(Gln) amidotransferase subunit C